MSSANRGASRTADSPGGIVIRSLAAIDPIRRLHRIENHDAAYVIWKRDAGLKRTLVHLDGHLDFYWIPEDSVDQLAAARAAESLGNTWRSKEWNIHGTPLRELATIGNFIYLAIRDQIINRFYWVVPDPFLSTDGSRELVRQSLETLLIGREEERSLRDDQKGFSLTLLGCPVTVCTLADLPAFREPVLLDIDTDYLFTKRCDYRPPYFSDEPVAPWLGLEGFRRKLAESRLPTDLVTVAYSIEGGYTPLAYKYWGDHIARFLERPSAPVVESPDEKSAAAYYDDFLVAWNANHQTDARTLWGRMVGADPTYQTLYALPAYRDELAGRLDQALAQYDRWAALDPDWYYPHLGRGRVLRALGRGAESERALRRACTLAKGPTMAWYWLGMSALDRQEWISADHHLRMALDGFPYDPNIWSAIAQLRAQQEQWSEAGAAIDHCFALGHESQNVQTLDQKIRRQLSKGATPMTYDPEAMFQRQSQMVTRRVAGEIILVPIHPRMAHEPALFTLDPVAAFLWDHLESPANGRLLASALREAYDVSDEQAETDVKTFLTELSEIGAIEPISVTTPA